MCAKQGRKQLQCRVEIALGSISILWEAFRVELALGSISMLREASPCFKHVVMLCCCIEHNIVESISGPFSCN